MLDFMALLDVGNVYVASHGRASRLMGHARVEDQNHRVSLIRKRRALTQV